MTPCIAKSAANRLFKLALLVLMASVAASGGAQPARVEQCYLSREYRANVQDRLLIQREGNRVEAFFWLTYCNYVDSPECFGPRSEELDVHGRSTGAVGANIIHAKSKDGSCSVLLRFQGTVLFVTQETRCPSLQYWGPHGVYTPTDSKAACE